MKAAIEPAAMDARSSGSNVPNTKYLAVLSRKGTPENQFGTWAAIHRATESI